MLLLEICSFGLFQIKMIILLTRNTYLVKKYKYFMSHFIALTISTKRSIKYTIPIRRDLRVTRAKKTLPRSLSLFMLSKEREILGERGHKEASVSE